MPIPFVDNHQLANPWWLLLLLVLLVLAWMRGRAGSAPALPFPTAGILGDLGRVTHSRAGGSAMNLLHLSLVFAVIALARPQKVVSYDTAKSEGIGIVVAFDVSLSMLIRDFYIGGRQVDRITAAKRVLVDFIKGRPSDRIGIIAFAGAPYNPCPPTLDHDWLLKNMDRIQTGIIEDGTAIGSGIAAAARRLDQLKVKSKVLLVMTDGANNSGKLSPQDAARLAATIGIRIHTISIGTPGMHPIYVPNGPPINSGRQEFDPETLQEVANIGGGSFFRAEDLSTLERIFKTIDELERTEIEHKKIVETKDLFHWFLLTATALAGIYLLWKQTLGHASPATA